MGSIGPTETVTLLRQQGGNQRKRRATAGYRVVTTIGYPYQPAAHEALQARLDRLRDRRHGYRGPEAHHNTAGGRGVGLETDTGRLHEHRVAAARRPPSDPEHWHKVWAEHRDVHVPLAINGQTIEDVED